MQEGLLDVTPVVLHVSQHRFAGARVPPLMIYRFGPFCLDVSTAQFFNGEQKLALSRKAFECLIYLIENRDRIVSRDELIERIWKGRPLSAGVVPQVILRIRKALDDTGPEHRYIETTHGFGYRWVGELAVVGDAANDDATGERIASLPRRSWWWPAAVALAVSLGVVAILLALIRPGPDTQTERFALPARAERDITLVMPVVMDRSSPDHAWIRLGIMDLINERMRTAGQAVVPSDTVVALLRDFHGDVGDAGMLNGLAEATNARWLVEARVERAGTGWRVHLRTLRGSEPPLAVMSENVEITVAASDAVSAMISGFGLSPPMEVAESSTELTQLAQKISAARLAYQMDTVSTLVDASPEELRRRPEIRFELARAYYQTGRVAEGRAIVDELLASFEIAEMPKLHGRVLQLLARALHSNSEFQEVNRILAEVNDLYESANVDDPLAWAQLYGNIGVVAVEQGNYDVGRTYLGYARDLYEGQGEISQRASVIEATALIETALGETAKAQQSLEQTIALARAARDLTREVRGLANVLYMHWLRVDVDGALALMPRMDLLLQRASNDELRVIADRQRISVLATAGRLREAESVRSLLKQRLESAPELPAMLRALVRAQLAAWALYQEADFQAAEENAAAVADDWPSLPRHFDTEVWLTLIRAHISQGHLPQAEETLTRWSAWESANAGNRVYVALAGAELAVARGEGDVAEQLYERALALADGMDIPRYRLRIVHSWLFSLLQNELSENLPVRERVLYLNDLMNEYASQDYDAALLQARVYHSLGQTAAWRVALERVERLAGERAIPDSLRRAPDPVAPKVVQDQKYNASVIKK